MAAVYAIMDGNERHEQACKTRPETSSLNFTIPEAIRATGNMFEEVRGSLRQFRIEAVCRPSLEAQMTCKLNCSFLYCFRVFLNWNYILEKTQ